jgi:uncharacterized protein YmfQ (DUF2313 family)
MYSDGIETKEEQLIDTLRLCLNEWNKAVGAARKNMTEKTYEARREAYQAKVTAQQNLSKHLIKGKCHIDYGLAN